MRADREIDPCSIVKPGADPIRFRMRKLRIYDIDGTVTHPGNDLWYLTTKHLCSDVAVFEEYVSNWKNELLSGKSPDESSYAMMSKGIRLMAEDTTGDQVKNTAKRMTGAIIKKAEYFTEAILHLEESLQNGYDVLLSTTNYQEGGVGFLEALIDHDLLHTNRRNRIHVSGTLVDWGRKSMVHFNMGEDKIKGVCDLLGMDREALRKRVDSCYGDDPEGNDKALLDFAPRAYVIQNKKNENSVLPGHAQLTSWDCIMGRSKVEG